MQFRHPDRAVPLLSGVAVLDLTRLLPGAYCTRLLADRGASVIKIEQPDVGDHLRSTPPLVDGQSVLFDALNHGKRSVALDLKTGVGAFRQLARRADVVVEGNRPGVMDRLGVGWSVLHELNPKLVLCSISGYGQEGDRASRAGHDLNYVAVAGALSLNGVAGGPPVPFGLQVADFAGGGVAAAFEIAAALAHVWRGGEGVHLDVSMSGGVAAWLAPQLAQLGVDGSPPERGWQPLTGRFPCYRVYECGDGRHYSVAALEPKFWQELCSALGDEALVPLQFDANAAAHGRLEELFRSRARDEWQRVFGDRDVCCEPVLTLDEIGHRTYPRGPALGEHTEEVLRELS